MNQDATTAAYDLSIDDCANLLRLTTGEVASLGAAERRLAYQLVVEAWVQLRRCNLLSPPKGKVGSNGVQSRLPQVA